MVLTGLYSAHCAEIAAYRLLSYVILLYAQNSSFSAPDDLSGPSPVATFNLTATEGLRFSVLLGVNPFERVPTGTPAPDELPPRYPYTRPNYSLSLVPTAQVGSQASAAFALVVGELLYADGALRPVAQYIPPSMALASHPALLQALHQLDFQLLELETDAKDISYVRIDRTRKIPLTVLVRALGFGSDDTIFEIFGENESLHLTVEKDIHKNTPPQQ